MLFYTFRVFDTAAGRISVLLTDRIARIPSLRATCFFHVTLATSRHIPYTASRGFFKCSQKTYVGDKRATALPPKRKILSLILVSRLPFVAVFSSKPLDFNFLVWFSASFISPLSNNYVNRL